MNNIPRRVRIDLMIPEEFSIFKLVGEVETLGTHPLLTDVINLLNDARNKLADWVDLKSHPLEIRYCAMCLKELNIDGNCPNGCYR